MDADQVPGGWWRRDMVTGEDAPGRGVGVRGRGPAGGPCPCSRIHNAYIASVMYWRDRLPRLESDDSRRDTTAGIAFMTIFVEILRRSARPRVSKMTSTPSSLMAAVNSFHS